MISLTNSDGMQVQVMKSAKSSAKESMAIKQARKRKARLDARISALSTAVDTAVSEFQKANRTEADIETKVKKATLAVNAARQAQIEHAQARDKLAADLVNNQRSESETSKRLNSVEMQVPIDRKTAAEALVKQTELQAEEARDLRSKQEAEQMMQQVNTEEKRADDAADDTTAKVNESPHSVCHAVLSHWPLGLLVLSILPLPTYKETTSNEEHRHTQSQRSAESTEGIEKMERREG